MAPTGKAERSIAECGIRSMTIHRFLKAYEQHEQKGEGEDQLLPPKTIVIVDEAGMVDSRRFEKLQSLVREAGVKIVPVGDNNQLQSVEAGPAYRLVCSKVKTVALETVVRQRVPWQREATRLFGLLQPRQALALYHQHGAFKIIAESMPDPKSPDHLIDAFCLARQVSGRMWKEIGEDYKAAFGKAIDFEEEGTFETLSKHKDFDLYIEWRDRRKGAVEAIIQNFDSQKSNLEKMGVDVERLGSLVSHYGAVLPEESGAPFNEIEGILRKMSYGNIYDTRIQTKQSLVSAWAADLNATPQQSHLMLAFTNRDANILNESARLVMREQGMVTGTDYLFKTKNIEEDDFGNTEVLYEDRTFAQGDRVLFTRNDEKLGVRNGTLGTILSLDQENITVLLDGKEKQELSFSPTAYPFIDNGWATTIHKAQSASVDHVKKLASYEEYRNLAYVGMTRHRHTLKIYVSDLDFWREEKIFDRLARVQEKLSGFDYLNEATVTEKLASEASPDAKITPSEEKAEREFWESLRKAGEATFVDARDTSKSKSQGFYSSSEDSESASASLRTDFLNEDYLSLEDSEEKRSAAIFKDPFDPRGKEAFLDAEDSESKPGKQTSQNHSSSEAKGSQSQEKPPEEKQEETQEEKQRDSEKPSASPIQTQQNSTAHTKQQVHEPSEPKGNEVGSSTCPSSTLSPSSSSPSSTPLTHEEFKEKLKAIQDKINRDYATQTVIKEKPLSYKEVEGQLKERVLNLAIEILGNPTSRTKDSLRFGSKGSVCVFISGEKQGIYTNFGTDGKGGGPLKLIQEQMGLSSAKDALKWGADWLGGNQVVVEQCIVAKKPVKQEQRESTWKPIVPIPNNAPEPDIVGNKYLNVMLRDGNKAKSRHAYRDEQGNLLGYVVRIEKPPVVQPDGSIEIPKITPPLTYGEDARGYKYWKWQAFYEKENRTPYGIEKLAQDKDQPIRKPVLVVEGEKTADKAQKDHPDLHVLTWVGGAGAVDKTNWACLVGRQVTIWPDYDYDQGSQKAAQKLHQILTQLNRDAGKEGLVGVVDLPDSLRHGPEPLKDGWDLADPLLEGWTPDTVRKMIKEALPHQDNHQDYSQDKEQQVHSQNTHKEHQTPPSQKDPLLDKREQFEKTRLPINQEWCANLGFMVQHKRLPETAEELSAAYWQGERLTAIEGRLYREVLERKKNIDEKQLTLQARTELAKNQVAPDHILAFGQSSDLMESRLKQLEQHALIHQDRTGNLPAHSELDTICRAIKVYGQIMETEGINNKVSEQGSPTKHTQGTLQDTTQRTFLADTVDIYRTLVEQQVVLGRIVNRTEEIDKEAKIMLKEEMRSILLKPNEIRDFCSGRLQRMDNKIQSMKEFAQEMKDLDLNRQNQRGLEM